MPQSKKIDISPIAQSHMNVSLQSAIAAEEKEIFYEHLVETKTYIERKLEKVLKRKTLDGWIVCGSGLAGLPHAKDITIIDRIAVSDIPHWFSPQAPGHGKELIIADIKGQKVGIATGRAHIYDTDTSPQQLKMITAPLIVAKGLGIHWLITTNAAGVLDNDHVHMGDVVVDVDYVNHHGVNPLMGPNDDRLGQRFPGKAHVADPHIFARLEKCIPEQNLHIGIYTLASNAPMYEGLGDIANGMYRELTKQNPEFVTAFGMSFAMDAITMQHFNSPSRDIHGFDRQVRWIGLTAATNIISVPNAPTKELLRNSAVPNPNPTNAEEVLEGGKIVEKLLIPGVVQLCASFTENPLPSF